MPDLARLRPRSPWGTMSVACSLLCLLVVAGVGAVALGAELLNTWNHYFLMETTIAAATPVATGLLGVAVLSGIGAVATT